MSQRPFAVFDIDGTLIRWQLFHAVVDQLAKDGALPESAHQRIKTARMEWKQRASDESFHDYEMTLLHTFHDSLTDISEAAYDAAIQTVFGCYKDQVYRYTRDVIRDLKQKGYLIFAISGSPQAIVDKLGECYGFDAVVGNHYVAENGMLTGERTSPIDTGKRVILERLIREYNATTVGSYAFGDSFGDGQMLETVDCPVAFNPDKRLYELAIQHGWTIVVERKNIAYTLKMRGDKYVLITE